LIWAFERRHGRAGAMNAPVLARTPCRLDRAAMQAAVDDLTARHEALRTTLEWRDRRLARLIHSHRSVRLRTTDLSGASDPEAALRRQVERESSTDIDVGRWPVRARLWRLSERDHVLGLNVHHLATDAWSQQLVLRDVAALYRRRSGTPDARLPNVAWQYSDFVDWQLARLAHPSVQRHVEYWAAKLDGARTAPLAGAGADGAGGPRLSSMTLARLDESAVAALADLARRERTTLFGVFLAVFYATLARACGASDLAVTTMLSERTRPELLETVGYFVCPVVLRTAFEPEAPFSDLVRRCRGTLLGALQHQDVPFHLLPPGVVDRSAVRLDDVALQVMGDPTERHPPFVPLELRDPRQIGRTFNLELVVRRLFGDWYATAFFTPRSVAAPRAARLVESFVELARRAAQDPDSPPPGGEP
jgi:Condensation domain